MLFGYMQCTEVSFRHRRDEIEEVSLLLILLVCTYPTRLCAILVDILTENEIEN